MHLGENIIAQAGTAPFFKVANGDEIGLDPAPLRRGDAVRTWVRSLSGFQKEALVRSTRSGLTWRLVSDEGAYLSGHDAAPCPLSFLTTGMIASYMNEIVALAAAQGVVLGQLQLIQDNFYTMKGSMRKRTMTGGALPVELEIKVECDLDDAALNELLMNAVHASPLNGLMRGKLPSLFTLTRNGDQVSTANADALDAPVVSGPSGAAPIAESDRSDADRKVGHVASQGSGEGHHRGCNQSEGRAGPHAEPRSDLHPARGWHQGDRAAALQPRRQHLQISQ